MSHAEAEVEAPEADQRTTVGSNRHRRVRAGLVREGADTRARAGRINAVGDLQLVARVVDVADESETIDADRCGRVEPSVVRAVERGDTVCARAGDVTAVR